MADPILFAKGADLDAFLAAYDPQVTPFHVSESTGQTVLFGALANRDPQTRVATANRLLDDGADAAVVTTSGVTLLHVLLGQRRHDPVGEATLLRRLLDGGAPVNRAHSRDGAPLAMLHRMQGVSHADRQPMYEAFFARPDLDLEAPASRMHTVRDALMRAMPNTPLLQPLVDAYDVRHGRDN